MNTKRRVVAGVVSGAVALVALVGLGALVGSAIAQAPAPAPNPIQISNYNAPDNPDNDGNSNTVDVASNATGTTDKTLRLTPTNSDKTFTVEVYDPETGDVVDSTQYSDGNTPPVVVGPGYKARIRDDNDSNQVRPKGTSTFG